jgi:hypothetical protein
MRLTGSFLARRYSAAQFIIIHELPRFENRNFAASRLCEPRKRRFTGLSKHYIVVSA